MNLNEAQQKAVIHESGPLLVIAGAGSGKTRVIISRILHLMQQRNCPPYTIIALTFTNKAAQEMKERILAQLGHEAEIPFIGTFHAYALRILKSNSAALGKTPFSILDEDDQQKILARIIQKNFLDKKLSPKQLSYKISQIKNSGVGAGDQFGETDPLIRQMYLAYQKELANSNCLDFDDLLLELLKLLQNAEFKKKWQARVAHMLVDEYQDTNVVQHELLKAMAKDGSRFVADSLCVVGDEDQSIYSWRGATVENIIYFKKDFPETTLITIEQNYRSVDQILSIANTVIQHNVKRNPKTLWSTRIGKDRVVQLSCMSGYQESEIIAQLVQTAQKTHTSIAIVYRTHFQSRIIEEGLLRHSIAYKIIGGIQFYDRKEIKDLIGYLRLMVNPFDRVSFFRVINCPGRGLGEKFAELFYDRWQAQPLLNFKQIANMLIDNNELTKSKKEALASLVSLFDAFSGFHQPVATLEQLITKIGYIPYLKDSFDPQEAETKIENVKEFIRAAAYFEQMGILTVQDMLDQIALMQEKMTAQTEKKVYQVVLMTLHAAKGLEFDLVIIPGLEEGLLPSGRALADPDALEEERRLFYVGITRAKERLVLMHTKYRSNYGTMTDQIASRFLDEVPKELVNIQECAQWNQTDIGHFCHQWMGKRAAATAPTKVHTFGHGHVSKPIHDHLAAPVAKQISHIGAWKKNQPVKHANFGVGIIKQIEQKGPQKTHLTIEFKSGLKKISAEFVTTT